MLVTSGEGAAKLKSGRDGDIEENKEGVAKKKVTKKKTQTIAE